MALQRFLLIFSMVLVFDIVDVKQDCVEAVEVRWEGVTAPATLRAASADARDWEHGVAQPLRDLGRALGQLGRALGTAVAEVVHAGGRCAAGLARFALYRAMPRRQRVSCSARSESALP